MLVYFEQISMKVEHWCYNIIYLVINMDFYITDHDVHWKPTTRSLVHLHDRMLEWHVRVSFGLNHGGHLKLLQHL